MYRTHEAYLKPSRGPEDSSGPSNPLEGGSYTLFRALEVGDKTKRAIQERAWEKGGGTLGEDISWNCVFGAMGPAPLTNLALFPHCCPTQTFPG